MEKIKIRLDFYRCEYCGFVYKDQEKAKRCEKFCSINKKGDPKLQKQGFKIRSSKD